MNRIATIFLAVTASLFFVGCYNDFDTPAPAKVWTDADFSDSKIISINEIRDEVSKNKFQMKFSDLGEAERGIVAKAVPMSISEAEPRDLGGKK